MKKYVEVATKMAAVWSGVVLCGNAVAFQYDSNDVSLRWNTDIGFGSVVRVEEQDPGLVGGANAASGENGGTAYSVNSDDGNLNFQSGDIGIAAFRVDSRFNLDVKGLSLTGRIYGRYDPVYDDDQSKQAGRPALPQETQDRLGSRVDLEELYLSYDFELGDQTLSVSAGRQVLNWGEVLTIPGGINFDAFDVARLRVPGSSVSEAKRANGLVRLGLDFTESVTLDLFYQYEWEATLPDANGSYFSTNDWVVPGGSFAMLGFGVAPEGFPNATLQRAPDQSPSDNGQYGVNVKWYSEVLNGTEFGFVAANYHSRIPYGSGLAFVTTPDTGQYFADYPEDIRLFGLTMATTIGDWSVGAEWAYRPNMPLQLDEVELFYEGLNFQGQIPGFVGNGNYVQGWRRHQVSQAAVSLLNSWGPGNWFKASNVVLLLEIAANKVHDLPSQDVLRYEGPSTFVKGQPDPDGRTLMINGQPVYQEGGWATDFSWGYRAVVRAEYNNAIGNWNLNPRLQWFHDVDGITPGNGGAFVEGTQQASLIANFESPGELEIEVGYNAYFGGGNANYLSDRDHVSLAVEYSF